MSRTYKDRHWKIRFPEQARLKDYEKVETPHGYSWLHLPTTKTKKRKEVDTEWRWMATPGWWVNMMMTRPQRRAGHVWETEVVKLSDEELEDTDPPDASRKPHVYYW